MNWIDKLKAIYTGKLPPGPVAEPPPKAPPKPRQPSKQRLELNERAAKLGLHIALQKGLWALCVTGEQSASRYTYYPTLDAVDAALTALEASNALV